MGAATAALGTSARPVRETKGRDRTISFKMLNERGLATERQRIIEEYKFDPEKVLEEAGDPRFSANRWERSYNREAVRMGRGSFGRLAEGATSSALSQLLRYGINRAAQQGYELEPSTYENDIAMVVPSKGFENYYAPMFRPGRGGPVNRGQKYPQIKVSALDVTIRNHKFGAVLEVERELIEDDQTGQVMSQGPEIGETLAYETDVYGYSQMAKATWVTQVSSNPGAISTPQLQEAKKKLRKTRDGNQNLISVRPDTILVDTDEEDDADRITGSIFDSNNPGATPTAGIPLYFGTKNPFRNAYKVVATPYVTEALRGLNNPNGWGNDNTTPAKWLLRAKSKAAILQTREPLSVVQETPNSGADFDSDTIRFKGRMRFGADVVDSRYGCRMN